MWFSMRSLTRSGCRGLLHSYHESIWCHKLSEHDAVNDNIYISRSGHTHAPCLYWWNTCWLIKHLFHQVASYERSLYRITEWLLAFCASLTLFVLRLYFPVCFIASLLVQTLAAASGAPFGFHCVHIFDALSGWYSCLQSCCVAAASVFNVVNILWTEAQQTHRNVYKLLGAGCSSNK